MAGESAALTTGSPKLPRSRRAFFLCEPYGADVKSPARVSRTGLLSNHTQAIIFRRAKGLRRFTSEDRGRFVVEVDEDGRATVRQAEPRRS